MNKAQKILSAVAQLQTLQHDSDTESAHAEADQVLCNLLEQLGCKEVVTVYKEIPKWYA